jgi:hypothetical protein
MSAAAGKTVHGYQLGSLPLVVLTLAGLGCGAGTGDVTGVVTYKNAPLEFGTVKILDHGGQAHDAQIQSDGTYTVTNLSVGPAQVAVTSIDPKMVEQLNQLAQRGKGGDQTGVRVNDVDLNRWSRIPRSYGDFSQSGLKLTVVKGTNPFDIHLE